ncbi:MAG: hypothetical protein RSB90_10760 [Eubacterium sp.]
MENDLIQYIEAGVPELKGYIYPVYGTETEHPILVYGTVPLTTGVVSESQLNIKIVAKKYDDCKRLVKKVTDTLDMSKNSVYKIIKKTRLRCIQSGGAEPIAYEVGGSEMFEAALYFIVKWRKLNGE